MGALSVSRLWLKDEGCAQRSSRRNGCLVLPRCFSCWFAVLGRKKVKKVSLCSLHRGSGSEHVLGMQTGGVGIGIASRWCGCCPGCSMRHPQVTAGRDPLAFTLVLGSVEGQHTWEKKSQEYWPGCFSPHRVHLEFNSSPEDAVGQTHRSKHRSAPLPRSHRSLRARLPRGLGELDKNPYFYFILLYLVPTTLHGGGILL